jgi:hypothetical protein
VRVRGRERETCLLCEALLFEEGKYDALFQKREDEVLRWRNS